jgi:hypothetical protein
MPLFGFPELALDLVAFLQSLLVFKRLLEIEPDLLVWVFLFRPGPLRAMAEYYPRMSRSA